MSEEQPTMRDQFNELMINARNEMIVQAANLYMFGQQVMHLGIGALALGKDELADLATRMVERGEIAEADIQQNVNVIVERIRARGEANDAELKAMAEKATLVLKENIRTILEQLHLPGGERIEALLKTPTDGEDEKRAPEPKE